MDLKLLALITPNKNGQLFCKNLDVMISVTSPQLPNYVTIAITFVETKFIPPLKTRKKLADDLGELLNTPKNLTLRASQKCE